MSTHFPGVVTRWVDTNNRVVGELTTDGVFTSIGGSVLNGVPTAENQTVDPSQKCTFMSDMLGDNALNEIATTAGSGVGNAVALLAGKGGLLLMTTSSTDATDAENFTAIEGPNSLAFRADAGGLAMEARVTLSSIASICLFVGFTDSLPSAALLVPIFMNGADIDSSAANACGVIFDTDATTDTWYHGGVKAGVDTVPAGSGAPTATVYNTVRVEVSDTGSVTGYIDGVALGTAVANAVTITTPLVPVVYIGNRSASARTCTLDYLWAQQNR